MFRADVEPMPENPPERLPYTGLWKVVIYEGERLVRTDREHITHSKATKIAREMNLQFGRKRRAKGAFGFN
jgi:hypothetical protein